MTAITLKKSITHDGQTFTVINIDEPTVGGIEAFENATLGGRAGETAGLIALLAVETGWPSEAIRKITASDVQKISDALAPFMPKPETGTSGAESAPK